MSKGMTWALGVIATIVGVFGGVWAMDAHFTPREIHRIINEQQNKEFETAIVQIQQTFRDLQSDRKVEKARDAVIYWMKMENILRVECTKDCNNQSLRIQLDNAIREKRKAEDYLRQVEGR